MAQSFAQAIGPLFFVVALGLVLLFIILRSRLDSAYIARYGDRRPRWQRWLGFPPDGSSWRGNFYFGHFNDPLVERRRRQLVVAFLVPFGLISALVALGVFGELSSP